MIPRPDQIAEQLEEWISTQLPNDTPADIAAALEIVRRRTTRRSIAEHADQPTITLKHIISGGREPLGPVTRHQLFGAVHA